MGEKRAKLEKEIYEVLVEEAEWTLVKAKGVIGGDLLHELCVTAAAKVTARVADRMAIAEQDSDTICR